MISRPTWAVECVPDQPGLCSETLPQINNKTAHLQEPILLQPPCLSCIVLLSLGINANYFLIYKDLSVKSSRYVGLQF